MNCSFVNPRSYKLGLGSNIEVRMKKKWEGGLGCYKLDDRVMTHNILQAREKTMTKEITAYQRVPKDPDCRCHVKEEKERMTPMMLPFVRTSLLHVLTFC